jgi:hypothetical protein
MHPLVVLGLETNVGKNGAVSQLIVASPLGSTYRVALDGATAERFKFMIASECKLMAKVGLSQDDDDDEDTSSSPERFSLN